MIEADDQQPARSPRPADTVYRVGAVSFLNSRPLIFGLADNPRVRLTLDVPAKLGRRLDDGSLSIALVPVIDIARAGPRWQVMQQAGCIASDDETLTVRIFSRVPIDQLNSLAVDADSHTSVALARIVLGRRFGLSPRMVATDMRPVLAQPADDRPDAVLLIGDKVVAAGPNDPNSPWPIQLDLGRAWRELTGLPFVFAAWAAPADRAAALDDLCQTLVAARDAGLANLELIARQAGPPLGWPAELAADYLTRNLAFELTPHRRAGLDRFFELAQAERLL